MKPDPVEQELRELAWRRPLKAAERARLATWLAQHPEARADWAADAALGAALARLPESPAPSNLTARVLAAIDREDANPAPSPKRNWLASLGWLPRVAVAVGLITGGGLLWHHQQRTAQQADALAALATVTEASTMPSPEALENFEVILKIHPGLQADTELLSMSKQLAEFQP